MLAFSNIFKTKWTKAEEKLNFGVRWVWVPMTPTAPPPSKKFVETPLGALTKVQNFGAHTNDYTAWPPVRNFDWGGRRFLRGDWPSQIQLIFTLSRKIHILTWCIELQYF